MTYGAGVRFYMVVEGNAYLALLSKNICFWINRKMFAQLCWVRWKTMMLNEDKPFGPRPIFP